MSKAPFRQVEIDIDFHQPDNNHHIPFKSFDDAETAERQAEGRLAARVLTDRKEAYGIALGGLLVEHATDTESRQFLGWLVSRAAINSTAYRGAEYAEEDAVERRNYRLEQIADGDWRQTMPDLQKEASEQFIAASRTISRLINNRLAPLPNPNKIKNSSQVLRRQLGRAAFTTSLTQVAELPTFSDPFEAQVWARKVAKATRNDTAVLNKKLNTVLSLAQFGDKEAPIYGIMAARGLRSVHFALQESRDVISELGIAA